MTDIVQPPEIDPLPDAPNRGDPAPVFSAAVGAFLAAMLPFRSQMDGAAAATFQNAVAVLERATDLAGAVDVAVAQSGLLGFSTSTLTMSPGNKPIHLSQPRTAFKLNDQVGVLSRADNSIRLLGNIVTWDGSDDMVVNVVAGGVLGSGTYSDWIVVHGDFLSAGATAAEVWAGETDAAAISPKTLKDEQAPQALDFSSTVTPNLRQGWNRTLQAPSSFTMGAPTNCKPGDVFICDIENTGAGVVLAVNSAWKRSSLGVINSANGARSKFFGFVDAVDGSGTMTRGSYNVQRL